MNVVRAGGSVLKGTFPVVGRAYLTDAFFSCRERKDGNGPEKKIGMGSNRGEEMLFVDWKM